jgi:hypothetical protein
MVPAVAFPVVAKSCCPLLNGQVLNDVGIEWQFRPFVALTVVDAPM